MGDGPRAAPQNSVGRGFMHTAVPEGTVVRPLINRFDCCCCVDIPSLLSAQFSLRARPRTAKIYRYEASLGETTQRPEGG